MCGIAGIVLREPGYVNAWPLLQLQAHRGPDDSGLLTASRGEFAVSLSQRYWIILNEWARRFGMHM